MTMYLRRRAQFSAGFSKPPTGEAGGGHNYLCEITVGGEIDPRTGMVINIKDVDAVLKSQVIALLHGTLLDRDVEEFHTTPPTPENMARWLWERCRSALPPDGALARLTLWPAASHWAEISQMTLEGTSPMVTITRAYDFSASHRLHSHALTDTENAETFGKCNWVNGHGHNYEVEVTLAGEPDTRTGRLFPTADLDRIVEEEVLKPYDHKHLNYDTPDFRDLNPTSENLTRVIWAKLSRRILIKDSGNVRLYKVAVRETARNYFEYYGESGPPGHR